MQSGEKGQRGRILEGKGWGVERVKGKEKQVASTREREQISKPNIPREEKKKGESKTTGAQLFFFSASFLFLFFFFWRSSKARFYGIVLQSGSVKSSQVKSDKKKKSKESRARETRGREERGGGRGCLYVCACFCVFVCVSVHKGRFGSEMCVYVQRGPSPHHPQSKHRLLRTQLFIDFFFLKLLMCILIFLLFCVPFFFFQFHLLSVVYL